MISTSWVQVKLKDASNQPRFLSYRGIDPEANLEKISLIHDIECCYYRGLINRRQVYEIEEWLCAGTVEDKYSLAAALAAIATISKLDDDTFTKNNDGKGLSAAEIQKELERLSETFTESLEIPLTIIEEINDHALAG